MQAEQWRGESLGHRGGFLQRESLLLMMPKSWARRAMSEEDMPNQAGQGQPLQTALNRHGESEQGEESLPSPRNARQLTGVSVSSGARPVSSAASTSRSSSASSYTGSSASASQSSAGSSSSGRSVSTSQGSSAGAVQGTVCQLHKPKSSCLEKRMHLTQAQGIKEAPYSLQEARGPG